MDLIQYLPLQKQKMYGEHYKNAYTVMEIIFIIQRKNTYPILEQNNLIKGL